MTDLDYTGPQGGMLGLAFGAGATFATALMLAVGKFIWNTFVLKERADCETKIRALEDKNLKLEARLEQLETVLIIYGPKGVSAPLSAAVAQREAAAAAAPDATDPPSTLSTPASSV